MPLTFVNSGETVTIKKAGGSAEMKRHIEDLGFVSGADVTVLSKIGGNIIVNIKETRVAVSKEIANKIMV